MTGVTARSDSGEQHFFPAQYVFSTMPVKELVQAFDTAPPAEVSQVSDGLMYRDFITVGLLLKRLNIKDPERSEPGERLLKDNWIYIQEPDVLVGRMQIFNNWSPYMVGDPDRVWIGLEYFCNDTDELWNKSDEDMIALALGEVEKMGIASTAPIAWMPPSSAWRRPIPRTSGRTIVSDRSRVRGSLSQPVSGRPQWHAQVQQSGPFHADGDDGGGQHHRRPTR